MANPQKKSKDHNRRKALRVRKKLRGSAEQPRLTVFRSLKNIYCQIIDDEAGKTLVAASSKDKAIRDSLKDLKKTEVAAKIGEEIASRAKAAGVGKVAFDRGGNRYHGRVKALAEAAREGGLEF